MSRPIPKLLLAATLLGGATMLAGCSHGATRGGLIGGAGGAVFGAVTGLGTAEGAIIGGAAGAVIGDKDEKHDRRKHRRNPDD